MFAIARMAPEEMWRTRMGLDELRNKMNSRATGERAAGKDMHPLAVLLRRRSYYLTALICRVSWWLPLCCLQGCSLYVLCIWPQLPS